MFHSNCWLKTHGLKGEEFKYSYHKLQLLKLLNNWNRACQIYQKGLEFTLNQNTFQ